MSHAVVRGKPNQSQLYLDEILHGVLQFKTDRDPSKVSVSEVLLFCMKRNLTRILMINGATGEYFTTEQILKKSVQLARALIHKNVKGRNVLMILRNHQHMATVYYGCLFAGAVPFMMDCNCKIYEFNHFKNLTRPSIVFCEQSQEFDISKAINYSDFKPDVVVADDDNYIKQFVADVSDDIVNFSIPDVDSDLPVMMLPTSGSTGLPKAALLSHKALVAQLPTLWTYHERFPRPTDMVMLISSAQWVTHTLLMMTCPVYQITLLMTPTPTINCLLEMLRRFKPTWTLIGPAYANFFASNSSPDDLESLRTVLITGAQPAPVTIKSLKAKLSRDVHLCNGYGTTETNGFITIPSKITPSESSGKILNIFDYKLVDESGKKVAIGENGELVLQSQTCIFQGYYRNKEAYEECLTEDRWWKTGDIFYENEDGDMFFVERKKFWFKYFNHQAKHVSRFRWWYMLLGLSVVVVAHTVELVHASVGGSVVLFFSSDQISPEEVEAVIGTVPGVQECVVCETPKGAAAGVVRRLNYEVTEADINHAVNSTLSDHKHLRGGIAFVPELPHTHTGKLHRTECREIINKLLGYKE